MRIGIDATPVVYERTGVGYYVYRFLETLKQKNLNDQFVLFYNFLPGRNRLPPLEVSQANFETRIHHYPEKLLRLMWRSISFPGVERLVGSVDIFHNLGFFAPPQRSGKQISTIHDLVFERFPAGFSSELRRFFRRVVEDMARRADFIITDSEASKFDIMDILRVPQSKIKVIYEAAGPNFRPLNEGDESEEVLRKYGIRKKFLLFVGALEPRKNLPFLIKAYSLLPSDIRRDIKLVLAGPKRWGHQDIEEAVRECGVEEDLVFTGYVDDLDLPYLYNYAEAFIFPSLWEGFGLPVLEAMSCGTPVICSNASSMPEIAGDAALMFDPHVLEQLVAKIQKLLGDSNLREKVRKRGLEEAKKFSWDKNVEETLAVYEEVSAS